ncbi:MAG: alpha-galactosidase [Planctomycetes bacterium]|nr:alpha-galactosidase [Planctomycetota bacterium]
MADSSDLRLETSMDSSGFVHLRCPGWEGFSLAGLAPAVWLEGIRRRVLRWQAATPAAAGGVTAEYELEGGARFRLQALPAGCCGVQWRSQLSYTGRTEAVLNRVELLQTDQAGSSIRFGSRPGQVRVLVQGAYHGDVVALQESPKITAASGSEPGSPGPQTLKPRQLASTHFAVFYDRGEKKAFLAGYETSERWNGQIELRTGAEGNVERWALGFDGGDLLLIPGETVELEDAVLLVGPDPHVLMESYGDLVRARHRPEIPPGPVVSWCSWYPYRLGVTEDRILGTARIAAERLAPLGMKIIEADLGWEKGQLPSVFEENEQFSRGLAWLAGELKGLGLELGVWKAPFAVSEFDPVAREHPEWLILDEQGKPAEAWTWFWQPHGKIFILDLTHPGAQEYLREKVRALHRKGVRYFKGDFLGFACHALAKRRFDRRMVAGSGVEAARRGARILREELPGALLLNCGGPELPGTGQWPLLYTCNDTGNTGCITWDFQRANLRSMACHLFKNRRWGLIQTSCLCVGLPGTLDEARMRATAAFLSGGQIDVGDTLQSLPEERWQVLEATLPPPDASARAVDLFEPAYDPGNADYVAVCKGEKANATEVREHPPGCVWHLHFKRDWDEWDLVAFFAFDTAGGSSQPPKIARFALPFERVGLCPSEKYWAYEFWSGQFLGLIPSKRVNPKGYVHPGDHQDLSVGGEPGWLDITFAGPGVKLLCLRRPRPHPWVAGTSFHQSCGAELEDVRWNLETRVLSGVAVRPAGHQGYVAISASGMAMRGAEVDGQPVTARRGSGGAWLVPVTTTASATRWRAMFES